MRDLIWVGNTLYPRWFVVAVVIGAFMVVVGLVTIARALLSRFHITAKAKEGK